MVNNNNNKSISLEGNIGSGKTTLFEEIKYKYKDDSRFVFVKEPVDEWEKIKDVEGNTMLKKFYSDTAKYSFAFQMMAYISRLKILRDTIKSLDPTKEYIIITERSLYTDRYVFSEMLYDDNKIEDVCYEIYLNWFDEFVQDFPIAYSIYVKTSPDKCYERIHIRAREGEELIQLSYLEVCHKYHEEFLEHINTKQLILDGNQNIYKNEPIVEEWLHQINQFIL